MELINVGLLILLLGKLFITKNHRLGYLLCFVVGSIFEVIGFLQIGIPNSAILNFVFLIWDIFNLASFLVEIWNKKKHLNKY